jgi:hypothetical protein
MVGAPRRVLVLILANFCQSPRRIVQISLLADLLVLMDVVPLAESTGRVLRLQSR